MEYSTGKLNQLRTDFDGYKPTVDAQLEVINQDLQVTKNDLLPPVGTILGWVPKLDKNDQPAVAISPGVNKSRPLETLETFEYSFNISAWQKCDRTTVNNENSPFHGRLTPNMNGADGLGQFLRGGSPDLALDYVADHVQNHK